MTTNAVFVEAMGLALVQLGENLAATKRHLAGHPVRLVRDHSADLLRQFPELVAALACAEVVNAAGGELLTANAKNLQETNRVIRTEMERGVFDIEAVKQANATLIATINESLAIADEGKAKRAAAEADLEKMEHELRDTLASAKARKDGVGTVAGTAAG